MMDELMLSFMQDMDAQEEQEEEKGVTESPFANAQQENFGAFFSMFQDIEDALVAHFGEDEDPKPPMFPFGKF